MSKNGNSDANLIEALHVQGGDVTVFEDFADSGQMWAGEGERDAIQTIKFQRPFIIAPTIQLSLSLLDARTEVMIRYRLSSKNVTAEQFDLVFSTWGDSKYARVCVNWIAIGQAIRDEYWVDY